MGRGVENHQEVTSAWKPVPTNVTPSRPTNGVKGCKKNNRLNLNTRFSKKKHKHRTPPRETVEQSQKTSRKDPEARNPRTPKRPYHGPQEIAHLNKKNSYKQPVWLTTSRMSSWDVRRIPALSSEIKKTRENIPDQKALSQMGRSEINNKLLGKLFELFINQRIPKVKFFPRDLLQKLGKRENMNSVWAGPLSIGRQRDSKARRETPGSSQASHSKG